MVGLTFQSIFATGSRGLGGAKGPGGAGVFDLFLENIELPGFADRPAFIILAAKSVDLEKGFITINAPPEVVEQSFDEVQKRDYFVWRVLPNPSEPWVLQRHEIGPGKLKATENWGSIQETKKASRPEARGKEDFAVARLFLVYRACEQVR